MRKFLAFCTLLGCLTGSSKLLAASGHAGPPTSLQCDALNQPLGDDNPKPLLSWRLQDGRIGARQTAYRILVASDLHKLIRGQADIWDSGRIVSSQSIGIPYSGPALQPETRYYWRVQLWDRQARAYPLSDPSWWETGLMSQQAWQGQWIGYEDREQRSVREADAQWVTNPALPDNPAKGASRHDFRLSFDVPGPVKHATLYVTGEDTAAAWINGAQVLDASQQPPWGRTPWRTWAHRDVTLQLHNGANLLALEITRFQSDGDSQTPMSATLYVEEADGSVHVWKTGSDDWKASLDAQGAWQQPAFDDRAWPAAVAFPPPRDAFGGADTLGDPVPTAAVAALRRSFSISRPIVSARLYATALGAYRFYLNGNTVGDQVLSPGWTDFREKVVYQTYDVTSMLKKGANAIGAWLAPGWYSTPLEWVGQGNNYGRTPDALRAQLKITYADGTSQWIATDASWKADPSPITFAEIYDGENYDARLQQPGWDQAGFSDARWHPVEVVHPHEPAIVWQSFPPIRATRSVPAKVVSTPRPGVFIYDFGQNLAGVERVRLSGHAGATVQLRFGELLNPDGTLYVANLRNAKATDHYTFASDGTVEYQPSFTFHGFRYMEITGIADKPSLDAVQAVVLHTDAPQTAQLKTASPMINQLWSNILWGQRSNFVGVPTDCPQRDERLGWAADAQVFWRTASYNMDVTAFSRKYAADLRGTQNSTGMYGIYAPGTSKQNPGYGPGWSDAGIIVPWTSWIQNGDDTIVRQNWDAMETYLAAILAANSDYLWKNKQGIAFGDWLAPESPTSEDLLATAYWAYDVSRMQQMAHALGRTQEEDQYAGLFEKIRAAFQRAYVHQQGLVVAQSEKETASVTNTGVVETQTGYVLALAFHLLADEMRAQAADRLVARIAANGWRLGTGFLGTPYLLEVLSDTGHADVAYRLLMNTDYPSWGYMVTHGATTMWERWNGDKMIGDPGMNSFNHYAYGAVGEWIYRYAAGVDTTPDDPGFHTILLHPVFDRRLGSVDFSYNSRYGMIHSAWTIGGGQIDWNITIPPNTTARVVLPGRTRSWKINGRPFAGNSLVQTDPTTVSTGFELQAGTYVITLPDNPIQN
ncbi:MAG TPA: family 78 glycoside hydrolase catalytic domain [Acidobacteriaceae bacterium]|jgi:alpha-L-rhamnosidase|nr:family 78 glycoside hydrolase catalytic domain [Acidobacteriaceae bacterium]